MKTQGMGQEEAMQERMNKVQTMRRPKDVAKRPTMQPQKARRTTSYTGAQRRASRQKDVCKKRTPHNARGHGGQKQIRLKQLQDCRKAAKANTKLGMQCTGKTKGH